MAEATYKKRYEIAEGEANELRAELANAREEIAEGCRMVAHLRGENDHLRTQLLEREQARQEIRGQWAEACEVIAEMRDKLHATDECAVRGLRADLAAMTRRATLAERDLNATRKGTQYELLAGL